MKKAVIMFISLVMIITVVFVSFMLSSGTTVITGYSLKCENDSYMIIEEAGSPIRYRFNKAVGTNVENLTDGDRILIISDLINESYPGSTSAYFILKLEDGDISHIPEETLGSLAELGWYKFTE